MFIQTEQTPNPATLKFLPGCEVVSSGGVEISSEEDAESKSPLAHQIFDVEGVSGIFFGSDFISVTKQDSFEWHSLKPSILSVIMDHFVAGRPVLYDEKDASITKKHEISDLDSEIVKQIKEILDTHVRPSVERDGGDVIFNDYKDGVVFLEMRGACSGCPSASMTLKSGVQKVLQHFVPEITDVREV